MSAVLDPSRPIVLADRYTLVRPLASGGMAEIFLARQKALAGFDKEIVIKLLKDRYRDDERVVEMFLEEARIGAVLNHPNIVHVYDVGEHNGVPFIAMELIHGEELSALCRRGLELGRFLPLQHALDLVRQAAEGMGYFHAKRRDDGENMAIVHRDISPSNLLVTQDGILKVIDFGIARANTRGGRKVEGIEKLVPGKYNYMSPEQVQGEQVDHRSDLYSLGIVLYEITVGKRLFKGRPEEVMRKIVNGKIKPPTFVRQKFPPELEAIVLRALEQHREERYQSAYELAGDLEEYLAEAGLKSGPVRIAQYLDDLRAAEGGERRSELVLVGQAWVDDDAEDALDFDRQFAEVVRGEDDAPSPRRAAADWDDDDDDDDDDVDARTGPRKKIDPEGIATPVVPMKALPPEAVPDAAAAPVVYAPQPTGPPPPAIPPGSLSAPMPAVRVDEPDRSGAWIRWVIMLALATAAGVVSFLLMR